MTREDCIRAYVAAGYTLIPLCDPKQPHDHISNGKWKPCKTPGKVPDISGWRKAKPGDYDDGNLKGNYGVVLHETDLVIDNDPRRHVDGVDSLARLLSDIGGGVATYVVFTGGGGHHIYYRIPAGTAVPASLSEYPGIDFKTVGGQVVGPGSRHHSGNLYTVKGNHHPGTVAQAPQGLLDLFARSSSAKPKKEVAPRETKETPKANDSDSNKQRFTNFLKTAKLAIDGQGGDNLTYRTAAVGHDLGLSEDATCALMARHWNERCSPPWEEDELRAKVAHAYRYARGAIGNKNVETQFTPIEDARTQVDLGEFGNGEPVTKEEKLWWTRNAAGKILKCFGNTCTYLAHPDYGLRGIFGFNQFAQRVEFLKPGPWHNGDKPKRGAPVQDSDLARMRAYLAQKEGYDAANQDLVDAMVDQAHKRKFHPVREYLAGLTWDKTPRIDQWLIDYCGAEDDEHGFVRAVSRKVLCAAVARAFVPGIKFDYVLVMEGAQGLGKSSICNILGGEWFADFKMNAGEKDTVQMMQGKWIVEMADLHVARQTDLDTLKSFLTRQVDQARFAYGRLAGEYPRQGIFIATYNPGPDGTYLKDDTGNRRWWPVRCHGVPPGSKHFDFRGLSAVRDQLFAEALSKWRGGERLYMDTTALDTAATKAQAERHAEAPWAERVGQWIAEQDLNVQTRAEFYTSRDIWVNAMQGLDSRFGRREQLECARAMKELGWSQGFKQSGLDKTVRGYWRPLAAKGSIPAIENAKKRKAEEVTLEGFE